MSLKIRRGLEADRLGIIPDEGELIYTTDDKLCYIGDGVTAGGNLIGIAPTGGFPIATAAGTVDAITATFTPPLTLTDKVVCAIVASGANTSTTPTFAPDGLTAHTIVKNGGAPLVAGDIPAALAVIILEYNLANTRWEIVDVQGDTLVTAGALINSATSKATPVDADMIGLMDSASANILKQLSWANLKATLNTYFAGIFQPLDSDLTDIAALTPSNDDFLQRKAGAWTNRTIAQVKTDLDLDHIAVSGATNIQGTITSGTTYYMGQVASAPTVTQGNRKVAVPKGATTLIGFEVFVLVSGTLGTGGITSTWNFRVDSTTDNLMLNTVTHDALANVPWTNHALNVSVADTSYFEIKVTHGTYTIPPTNVLYGWNAIFK